MKTFFTQIFQDENKRFSSNRFVGIVCAMSLCITMFISAFTHQSIAPPSYIVEPVALLAFGSLGLGAANKIFKRKNKQEDETV
jgi:hypothetical protein